MLDEKGAEYRAKGKTTLFDKIKEAKVSKLND